MNEVKAPADKQIIKQKTAARKKRTHRPASRAKVGAIAICSLLLVLLIVELVNGTYAIQGNFLDVKNSLANTGQKPLS